MNAQVEPVLTMELAPREWKDSRAAVYRDSVEHGVKQVQQSTVYSPRTDFHKSNPWDLEEGYLVQNVCFLQGPFI